jgi:hypothetical protein
VSNYKLRFRIDKSQNKVGKRYLLDYGEAAAVIKDAIALARGQKIMEFD